MEETINGFINYLHNVKKMSDNTEMSYRRDLNKLGNYLKGKPLSDVTVDDLQTYISNMG